MNELEVINGLYQGHYQQGQPPAPQAEMVSQESEATLRQLLEASQQREESMRRQIEDLEREVTELREEQHPAKRVRRSSESEYPEPPISMAANGISS